MLNARLIFLDTIVIGQAGRDMINRTGWQRHEKYYRPGRDMSNRTGWKGHE
jgi:hypothetical protein